MGFLVGPYEKALTFYSLVVGEKEQSFVVLLEKLHDLFSVHVPEITDVYGIWPQFDGARSEHPTMPGVSSAASDICTELYEGWLCLEQHVGWAESSGSGRQARGMFIRKVRAHGCSPKGSIIKAEM